MHILIVTPAPEGSRAGNRATAERWALLLGSAGHRVDIVTDYQGENADLMLALHTWRSHDAIKCFREVHPSKPLIAVLTGTDIYQFQHSEPGTTLESMALAHVLIGLHRKVAEDIPAIHRDKLRTVLQSAEPKTAERTLREPAFNVCVIGHLRDEKDSLRAATAARLLPDTSKIRILQAGKPHNTDWERLAIQEQNTNQRFHWLGEVDGQGVQQLMTRSQVMVISSIMEGGANVVSEACCAGLPIIASDIPGNRGLLGDDYPGYYPPKDKQALARLLQRAENEPDFLARLQHCVDQRAGDFTPAAEQAALLDAIDYACSTIGSMSSP